MRILDPLEWMLMLGLLTLAAGGFTAFHIHASAAQDALEDTHADAVAAAHAALTDAAERGDTINVALADAVDAATSVGTDHNPDIHADVAAHPDTYGIDIRATAQGGLHSGAAVESRVTAPTDLIRHDLDNEDPP